MMTTSCDSKKNSDPNLQTPPRETTRRPYGDAPPTMPVDLMVGTCTISRSSVTMQMCYGHRLGAAGILYCGHTVRLWVQPGGRRVGELSFLRYTDGFVCPKAISSLTSVLDGRL